jgi:threonine aldolase
MHDIIDLRSDTVTRPSDGMRQAMRDAEVGDAVYAEDPTVNRLERTVARLLGKEAALYVATGTMSNALAIRLAASPGDEVIADANCHPVYYEAGGPSAFSGVVFKTVAAPRGILTTDLVSPLMHDPVYYRPTQKALLIENTHNRGGGAVYAVGTVRALAALAHERGLRLHMDGARLWNACIAAKVSPAEFCREVDTISVCFSKGLGAPVGSVLAGSAQDIERAWHYRHMLGGTWRQAGILAAAALYALSNNFKRLTEDHANAQRLAMALSSRLGLEVVNKVETNMVFFKHPETPRVVAALKEKNVIVSEADPGVLRCVTHLDVDREDIDAAVEILAGVV